MRRSPPPPPPLAATSSSPSSSSSSYRQLICQGIFIAMLFCCCFCFCFYCCQRPIFGDVPSSSQPTLPPPLLLIVCKRTRSDFYLWASIHTCKVEASKRSSDRLVFMLFMLLLLDMKRSQPKILLLCSLWLTRRLFFLSLPLSLSPSLDLYYHHHLIDHRCLGDTHGAPFFFFLLLLLLISRGWVVHTAV